MRIQPNSTVNLYSGVDIDFTSGIEIAFSSIANQRAYFNSKLAMPGVTCTVVKKTGRIRLEAAGTLVKNCNYISFVNPSFDNKVIYARILDYDYINNECTEIAWQIDFWQTWMFDVNFEKSGIARQYLNETDYTRASANPYDKRIYAFQTPEPLLYNKTLENYNYKYRMNHGNYGDSAMYADADNDGCYPMLMSNFSNSDEAFESLLGTDMQYLLMLAPIDFSALGDDARDLYTSWTTQIAQNDGFYVKANRDGYFIGEPYSPSEHAYNHQWWSAFPHPYDIWMIPAKLGAPNQDFEYFITEFLYYLTSWNATGQIIGMYAVPKYVNRFFGVTSTKPIEQEGKDSYNYNSDDTFKFRTSYSRAHQVGYDKYVPACQKLYLSPYSYVRVETPDGDIKEYQYENFADINKEQSAQDFFKFRVVATANNRPKVILEPLRYKSINNLSDQQHTVTIDDNNYIYTPDTAGNFNVEERIELNSFPQIPYVIDAYLAHISATYMNEVAQNTSQAQIERDHLLAVADAGNFHAGMESAGGLAKDTVTTAGLTATGAAIGSALGPAGTLIGGLIGFGIGAMGTTSDMAKNTVEMERTAMEQDRVKAKMDMLTEASSFLSDPSKDNPRFNDTKPAYANNVYVPGSMGDTSYLKLSSLTDFKVTQVTLRDAILQKYDEYFKTYGYNFAGTVDVPYVVHYVQGSNSNDELPHWEQVNGKDSTYIKTYDCHITHSMLPVSVAIEGMFNCGVRMLKGETL